MWSLLFNLKNFGIKSGYICKFIFFENFEIMFIVIVLDFKDFIFIFSN